MKKTQSIEVLVLLVLLIILAWYGVTTYVIKPIREETAAVNESITMKEAEIKTSYYTVSAYKKNSDRLRKVTTALEKCRNSFYAEEKEETYLGLISKNITETKVEFTSLSALEGNLKASALSAHSTPSSEIQEILSQVEEMKDSRLVTPDGFKSFYEKMKQNGGRIETDIVTTTMTVEAVGKYNSVMNYLTGLTTDAKNVICSSMTLDIPENVSVKASTNPTVRMVVTLIYVSVPGIADYCTVPQPESLPAYEFPKNIIDGSFRSEGLLGLFGGAF